MNENLVHRQKNYRIREMLETDITELVEIERVAHDYPWARKNIESSLFSTHQCMVLECEHKLIAYAVSSTAADEAELLNIIVAKPYQSIGLGGLLVECVCGLFDHTIQTLFLEVRASNQAAIYLYHRLEFNEVGLRPSYYPARNGREDAIIMAKSLT